MCLKGDIAILFISLLCNRYEFCSSAKQENDTIGTIWNDSFIAENDTDLHPDYYAFNISMTPVPFYKDYEDSYGLYEPLTLDEAEELLQRNETQFFLESFTNENQRRVLANHLRFCPYTPLCNFSFEIFLGPNMDSPCGMCFCTNDCDLNKNCCPDIIDFSTFGADPKLKQTECLDFSLKKSGSLDYTFQTVTTCSNTDQPGSRSHDLCTNDLDNADFNSILPVTDEMKNVTYKNRHCAVCNSVPEENLVSWQPKLNCGSSEENLHVYTTETELIQFVLASETCNLIFSPPFESVGITYCVQMIETCNKTGTWSSFDPFLHSACLFYEHMYTVTVRPANVSESKTVLYRNLFCALCNGESPEAVFLDSVHHYDGGRGSEVYAFSGLLKFNSQPEETTDSADDRCENGFIYDLRTESCLELTCSPLRTLRNNTCEPMFSQIRSVVYIITARLYPIGGWAEVLDNLHIAFPEITDQMGEDIQYLLLFELDIAPQIPEYGMYSYSSTDAMGPCYISLSRGLMDTCSESPCKSEDSGHYEIEVRFEVISEWHDLDDVMFVLTELEATSYKVTVQEVDYLFKLHVRDFGERIRSPGDSLERDGSCNKQAEIVNLSKQRTCPLVLINFTHFNCYENIDGLSCSTFNITLNSSDYVFLNSNDSLVSVCSDVYLKLFAHSLTKETDISSVLIVLSLVCTVVSLICLLFSFVTFCLFPRLRTLPGKNNMALIFSLMIAQSMFLISSFGRFERGSDQCKAVGVLTHFSWLLAIFWMNVCTFHVFRVFTGIDKLVVENEFKTILRYFIYTIVTSVLIICLNICVSLLSSDMSEFGYGKTSCYISSEKMVGFTFGIPVGFVIVTNFIMFLFFVIKIKRVPVIKKDVKNERNDMIVFTKLSSLTGFTWIFGFVYSWTDIEVFSYLFIVLNASQGVFLLLSFVCNKRVLDMFRNRSFGVTATSEAYRTRVTGSTQSSVKRV